MQKIYIAMLFILLVFVSLLVMLTRGQPLLVRRKVVLGLLLASLATPQALLVSCRPEQKKFSFQKDVWESSGWVDAETYRKRGSGNPKPGLKNPAQMKGTARESAILQAQYQIIEEFRPRINESCASIGSYNSSSIALAQEINGIVKGGTVIAIRYHDDFSCEIIYEIKSKDLRKKIENYQNNY